MPSLRSLSRFLIKLCSPVTGERAFARRFRSLLVAGRVLRFVFVLFSSQLLDSDDCLVSFAGFLLSRCLGLGRYLILTLCFYRIKSDDFFSFGLQMLSTVLVLLLGRRLGYVSFPPLQRDTFVKIWPLPLIYVGNMMFGLGGTQQLRYA